MNSKEIGKITDEINKKYPNAGVQKIEYDDQSGKASFFIRPTNQILASLPGNEAIKLRPIELASTLRRSAVDRTTLDLIKKSPYTDSPRNIFKRAMQYYFEYDVYGSHIDVLTNFASKGFENDIDDSKLKAFYDSWCFDVNFKQVLDWIFFDLFRIGMVRTYKIIGKYNPGVSYLSSVPGQSLDTALLKELADRADRINKRREDKLKGQKASAAKKKIWSKGYVPIAYTILNPLLIEIEGSLLFDKSKVTLTPSDELKKMLAKPKSELTEDEKEIIKLLPTDFKRQTESGGTIELDPLFVGAIDYRKQPYERYPRPRGIKAFDSLEYKNSLRQADLSTLDGISNYILKITIGSDEFPVTNQNELETVAKLFDTPSKSFDVVWNHTLQIEKIVSPEIEAILGQDKYRQVNEDITGALAVSRLLIDGGGEVNEAAAALLAKTVIEEINYARRLVTRWIYNEYRQIANAMGFKKFPKVRWDNTVLRDMILYMSTIAELVDRRMLSYETALGQLGFDYENEFNNMKNELPSVIEGVLGIIGSPFQKSGSNLQPVQNAPKGTPSYGRPKGKPGTKKKPSTDNKTKVPKQTPSQQPNASPQAAGLTIAKIIQAMDNEEFAGFVNYLDGIRNNEEE